MVIAKVMVVDDNNQDREMLAWALRRHGMEVIEVADPREAVATAAAGQPDIIILDLVMPLMDGFEVCKRLKLDPPTHEIPVVFLSSSDNPSDTIRSLHLGCIDFLHKPISFDELAEIVLRHNAIESVTKAWRRVRPHLIRFAEKYGGDDDDRAL